MKRTLSILCLLLLPACGRITCSQARHKSIEHLNNGVKLYSDGRHNEAVNELKSAVQADNTFSDAHYNLAKVYLEMERWSDAEKHLSEVTRLQPENAGAHHWLGLCFQQLGQTDLAKRSYEKALSLNGKLYEAYFRLGTIAEEEDKPKEADAHYRKAIQINPRYVKSFVKLALLYLNHDYPELALNVLTTAQSINDTDAEIHKFLGLAHQALKQYEQAIASFQKALKLKPGMYDAMYNLGMAYAAADNAKDAEVWLDRFAKAASTKKEIDKDFVRAAQEKIAELHGMTISGSLTPLPQKQPEK